MSVDELIDPPYFPALDKKYNSLKGSSTLNIILGVLFLIGGIGLSSTAVAQGATYSPAGLGLIAIGVFGLVMSRVNAKRLVKVEKQLQDAVSNYITSERNKLNAIKAKMSDVEWENYKLQLQNQKLLVQINKKQNIKTQTTTTTSFISEIGD